MDIVFAQRRAERLPLALLAYGVALAVFLLIPPLLKASVGPPVGFTQQEAVDLFTPIVVIPLAWYVFDLAGGLGRRGTLAFVVLAALWAAGQGMHLAANAIGDAFPTVADSQVWYQTAPGDLSHWLDEVLSHWMWHVAWVGLSILMLTAVTLGGRSAPGSTAVAGVAGLIHGVTFFFVTTEGGTTQLGIPACAVFLVWAGALALRRERGPVVTFFAVASLVTLLAYLGWAAVNQWTLPEPCTTLNLC